MAIVMGTNAGFVLTAPTADPSGDSSFIIDGDALALKDLLPSDATKIIEIGIFTDSNTQVGANWEVGIYDDTGSVAPGDAIGLDQTNTFSSGAGWKRVTVDIDVSSHQSTDLWMAFQLDNVAGATEIARSGVGSEKTFGFQTRSTLSDPFGSGSTSSRIYCIYALYETTTATVRLIKIAGSFVEKPILTKVGGTFVDKPIKIKIGGTFVDA